MKLVSQLAFKLSMDAKFKFRVFEIEVKTFWMVGSTARVTNDDKRVLAIIRITRGGES